MFRRLRITRAYFVVSSLIVCSNPFEDDVLTTRTPQQTTRCAIKARHNRKSVVKSFCRSKLHHNLHVETFYGPCANTVLRVFCMPCHPPPVQSHSVVDGIEMKWNGSNPRPHVVICTRLAALYVNVAEEQDRFVWGSTYPPINRSIKCKIQQ